MKEQMKIDEIRKGLFCTQAGICLWRTEGSKGAKRCSHNPAIRSGGV